MGQRQLREWAASAPIQVMGAGRLTGLGEALAPVCRWFSLETYRPAAALERDVPKAPVTAWNRDSSLASSEYCRLMWPSRQPVDISTSRGSLRRLL